LDAQESLTPGDFLKMHHAHHMILPRLRSHIRRALSSTKKSKPSDRVMTLVRQLVNTIRQRLAISSDFSTMTLPPPSSTTAVSFGRGKIRLARRGHNSSILLIALSRPRVKNAFSDDLYLDLVDVLQDVAADDSLSALVLTSEGSYFSSGADLKGNFMPEEDGGTRDTLNKPPGKFMMALLSFPKLVAAAVQGPAVGIAVTLLLHCDLCFCTPQATFWAPFTRLALVPEFCSSTTLVETMGIAKANELLMLSKKIDAETALQWNLCSRIVNDCDTSGNPFHPNSLGSYMSREIDEQLLRLPRGVQTAKVREALCMASVLLIHSQSYTIFPMS
jgi:peroxisomal 3,2-trans-enoyl-CoA isomerase